MRNDLEVFATTLPQKHLNLFAKLDKKDFDLELGQCFIEEKARKLLISSWQNRKKETVQHPFIKEKIEIGLIPFVQAQLLARVLRGDLDEYPPFIWR